MKFELYIFLTFMVLLNSCKVFQPNRMFKQGNYEYFQVQKEALNDYIVQKGDLLSLEVFTRDGFEIVDVLSKASSGVQNSVQANQFQYLVEEDGMVELPIFGRINVLGFTVNQLEDNLEEKGKALFKDPFIILKVTNRRAFVFKGSNASIVSLNEAPTNLLEVIARSGGIGNDLKAYKIRILRGDLRQPEIINVDLSTIEGLRSAELIVQSNDIIYIEQRFRFTSEILSELAPILSLATSLTTFIILINNLRR